MTVDINPGRIIPTAELLDAVPLRNRLAVVESRRDDELVLATPLRRTWYMTPPLSWIFPFSSRRRIALDALGIEVWESCDGRTPAQTIIEQFARRHALTFHEARLSVMLFLKQLTQRGMIVMAGASAKEAGE